MPTVRVEVRVRPVAQGVLRCTDTTVTAGTRTYTFDAVHTATSQEALFEGSVCPLVDAFLSGIDCSVIAYGQTGSGKTHTIGISPRSTDAMVQRALVYLFSRGYTPSCSLIEIYNEEIVDLLSSERHVLALRSSGSSACLVGLTELTPETVAEALSILRAACATRTTGSTNMNSESSRSHAVLTLKLNSASLSFVDLAGSERLKRTLCRGPSARESIAINSGLLALANVISALSARKSHVPFRDSKLTRILQPCLSTKLLFIACVSPLLSDLPETANTLLYAARAASISSLSLHSQQRVSSSDSSRLEIITLQREISRLKVENQRLRAQLKTGSIEGHPYVQRLETELRALKAELRQAAPVVPFPSADSVEQCAISVVMVEGQRLAADKEVEKSSMLSDYNRTEQPKGTEAESITQNTAVFRKVAAERASDTIRVPFIALNDDESVIDDIRTARKSEVSGSCGKQKDASYHNHESQHGVPSDIPPAYHQTRVHDRSLEQNYGCNDHGDGRKESKGDAEHSQDVSLPYSTINSISKDENGNIEQMSGKGNEDGNKIRHPGSIRNRDGKESKTEGKRRLEKKPTQHKRIVTFDLEPKTKRGLATPRREAIRIAPVLVSSMPVATTALAAAESFPVACLADGQFVAVRERMEELFKEKGSVTQLSFSLSFGLFYTAGSVLKVFCAGDRPKPVYACKASITALEVFGSTVVMGHADGSITLFDLVSNRVVMSDRVHAGAVLAMAREGEVLYTGSLDHSIRCVRAGERGPWPALEPPHYGAISALLEYRGLLVSAGRDGAMKTWRRGVPFKTVAGAHPAAIRSGAVVEGSGCWVTGCRGGELRCWDLTDGTVRCVGKTDNGQAIERIAAVGNGVWVAGIRELRRYELR